ncbi:hypothetical protein [Winogradskya humida]|uniref:Integral membrane protein n=1 Tax=Winogradskya humida TaxID=113566 RepID=A0ABQ3ZW80_9ACTN|nr:hypothetical protein [Actinoplanes humidus]GIE22779.1 hypothetical protein Ahu01nite_058810 [Actinoplanes humidus]
MTALETRYRRLLAIYPAGHRHEYGDEMVGVLMSGARPGQRRPSLPDIADVLRNGLIVRLLGAPSAGPDLGRRDAAVVAALFGSFVLAVVPLRRIAWPMSWLASADEHSFPGAYMVVQSTDLLLRSLGWILVAAALTLGWRWIAVALAVLAGLLEISVLAFADGGTPRWLASGWLLVAVPALVGLLAYATRGRRPARILGRRGVTRLSTGVFLAGMSGGVSYLVALDGVRSAVSVPLFLAGVFLTGSALWRADAEVRPALGVMLAGLAAIAAGQPLLEDAVDMSARSTVTSGVAGSAAFYLLALPAVITALATLPLIWPGRRTLARSR